MLPWLLLATFPVSATALLYARREYRLRGRLGVVGVLLLCAMLLMPNLMIDAAISYALPSTLLDFAGAAVALGGLAFCLAGILSFRSLAQVLCLKAGTLTVTGPYRWSRNPQYVGWFAFLLGFTLMDWSLWCLAALLVVAASLHLLVLIEEEHLQRVFGESFSAYRRQVPRYLGRRA
jgi:protein-S-isoprenylcysteine O-methyltransferase Ste14